MLNHLSINVLGYQPCYDQHPSAHSARSLETDQPANHCLAPFQVREYKSCPKANNQAADRTTDSRTTAFERHFALAPLPLSALPTIFDRTEVQD